MLTFTLVLHALNDILATFTLLPTIIHTSYRLLYEFFFFFAGSLLYDLRRSKSVNGKFCKSMQE